MTSQHAARVAQARSRHTLLGSSNCPRDTTTLIAQSVIVAEPPPTLQMNMRPSTARKSHAGTLATLDQFATELRKKRLNVTSQNLEESMVVYIGERLLGMCQ